MGSVLASVLSVPACHAGQFLYLLRMDRGHCGVCHRLHVCLGNTGRLFRVLFRLCRFGRDRALGLFSLCRLACHLGRASRVLHGTVSTSTGKALL